MEDWKITLNPEKTIYTIGLEFEPEQKKYTVVTKDEKGNSYKGMIYKASLGIIQGDTLTLKGEEIDKFESQRSVLTLQGRSDLEIVEQKVLEDRTQIAVTVKQLYKYDASTLWGIVESTVGHKQSISIALVNAKTDEVMFNFSKKDLSVYLDLPYDQAAYKVGETNKYKACTVFLKSDGTPGEYKPEEIKQGILPKASDKQEKKKRTFEKDYIHRDTPKEGNEDVIPVTFKKLPYKKIAVLVLMPLACLLVGFVLGTWIGKKQVKGVDEKQYVKLAEYEKLEAENNRLKQANDELFGENEGLKTRLQELAIDPKAGGGSSDVIDQQRNELIEKLKGTDFTQADIDKLKNPNQEEQYLIEDCDACLRLLYATKPNDKKNAQKNIKEKSGWYYSELYEKIKIQAHKDAMYEIILGDYEGAFTTVDIIRNNPNRNRSIANAIQKYKENMGNK